ncbi:MAG: adventurous gliding motility lipoprotein CglB [Myxococcaceae bacterium]|nr:adventurous gliding motility lipoprotein CglB [Myxococcaceae bacterium]
MNRISLLAVKLLVGCQTYDLLPVAPEVIVVSPKDIVVEATLKPNLMLAVDRSGSMGRTTSNDATCRDCGSGICPASCPTRMSDLRQAVTTFTQLASSRVRLGLTVFPEETSEIGAEASCRAPTAVRVPLPAPSRDDDDVASQANLTAATQVTAEVQRLTPGGGTPTGATLAFLATQTSLTDRRDFRHDYVVLLTDGLPNCNASNPNDYETNALACRCQSGSGDCSGLEIRRRGCLDADATVAQVEALERLGVKTIVVGFGADTNQADAQAVLSRMAAAGGFGPALQASNRAELEATLNRILMGLGRQCAFDLPAPPISSATVSVRVNGAVVPQSASTWTVSGRLLTLSSAFCSANLGATLSVQVASSP